ncbi:MBL fold metallo-hydrolase [Caldivirga sp. UBA161]|uniref:MBL fold metallo-hydrolase n=1 Tax=Caldivirga sp. UBA161 TaxID=1915569 RepID=UPI0025B8B537|nr:MBL fold metallo-hydrolase [Caldivirga sp. UBA161]
MVEVTVQELTSRVSLVGTYYGDVELNMVYVKDSGVLLDTSTSSIIEEVIKVIGLPKVAIITHPHEDHAGGSGYLASRGVKVIAHEAARGFLYNNVINVDSFFPLKYRSCFTPEFTESFIRDFRSKVGSPVVHESFRGMLDLNGVKCIEAFGHTSGTVVCIVDNVMFTSDAVQGLGIRGLSTTDSIPQVSSIDDYLQTLNTLKSIKVKMLVPGHNYLPFAKRVLEGNEIEGFIEASIEAINRLLGIAKALLSERALTICEFADNLIHEYGVKRSLYPQALITANAIIRFYKRRRLLKIIKEGDVELYSIK